MLCLRRVVTGDVYRPAPLYEEFEEQNQLASWRRQLTNMLCLSNASYCGKVNRSSSIYLSAGIVQEPDFATEKYLFFLPSCCNNRHTHCKPQDNSQPRHFVTRVAVVLCTYIISSFPSSRQQRSLLSHSRYQMKKMNFSLILGY